MASSPPARCLRGIFPITAAASTLGTSPNVPVAVYLYDSQIEHMVWIDTNGDVVPEFHGK